MDRRDCIFPDCQIQTDFGKGCEHSCPFQEDERQERHKWIRDHQQSEEKLNGSSF